jgi:two-component system, chemotaxis family, response regulator WspR
LTGSTWCAASVSIPRLARIPIIVLSSKEDSAVKSQAFTAGANELVARIRHHSSAYLNQIQRDEAYRALRESQQQLVESNKSLVALNQKLEEANRTISELARTDSLTGLTNRRVFEEELNREAQRATRKERRIWRTLKLGTRSPRNREGDQKSKSGAGRTRAPLDRKQLTAI